MRSLHSVSRVHPQLDKKRSCCYFEADVLARRPPSRINFLADVSDRLLSAERDESHDSDPAVGDDDCCRQGVGEAQRYDMISCFFLAFYSLTQVGQFFTFDGNVLGPFPILFAALTQGAVIFLQFPLALNGGLVMGGQHE